MRNTRRPARRHHQRPADPAISARLDRRAGDGPLNRRGFATSVFCRQCGETLDCPNCSVTLTVHRAAKRAAATIATTRRSLPHRVREMRGFHTSSTSVSAASGSKQKWRRSSHARVTRVDRDTIRRRGAITVLLKRFAAGDIDVLVGTDDCEGRLPAGHAGRRDLGRRRGSARGLPRGRADVPASHAGGGPRRTRRGRG